MRLALGLEYDGTGYRGWQTQPGGGTLQDVVEGALGRIAGHPVATVCAGRTDAGVHACGQVVHCDVDQLRPINAWVRGVNALLPRAVCVRWAQFVTADFNARYSAVGRSYDYYLLDGPVRPALLRNYVAWHHHALWIEAMREGAASLLGWQDFSAFRAAQCQAKSTLRELRSLEIERRGGLIRFQFEANAFLHHMVRNLVASLVWVGAGKFPVHWLADVLASGDRRLAGPTAAACGLHLVGVEYPAALNFPPPGSPGFLQ